MKRNLWKEIRQNKRLQVFEKQGFKRGEQKGKTMDVNDWTIMQSARKQIRDLELSWAAYYVAVMPSTKTRCREELFQKISDIRNVAGCLFLKVEEGDKHP